MGDDIREVPGYSVTFPENKTQQELERQEAGEGRLDPKTKDSTSSIKDMPVLFRNVKNSGRNVFRP
jgi:hypothetical protein